MVSGSEVAHRQLVLVSVHTRPLEGAMRTARA